MGGVALPTSQNKSVTIGRDRRSSLLCYYFFSAADAARGIRQEFDEWG